MKAQISELEEARMKVVEANKKLSFLTMSDSLTGLLNRRGFDRGIAQALATAQRNSLMITLYMLDVDSFKLYNDNYGHVKGDEALRGVGKALRQVFGRSTDIIARYGGEEFAVVFVGENPNASVTLANDLILAVKELGIVHEFSSVSGLLTLSAGSATIRVDESDTVERLIQRADDALYAAKEGGRNRICFTGVIPELPGRMKSGLKPLVIDEGDT
jgi:diguanylate cyclase (GGDEF)-like protein